jgi:hypothetical protein
MDSGKKLKNTQNFLELFKINGGNIEILNLSKWNLNLFKIKMKNSSKMKLKEIIL